MLFRQLAEIRVVNGAKRIHLFNNIVHYRLFFFIQSSRRDELNFNHNILLFHIVDTYTDYYFQRGLSRIALQQYRLQINSTIILRPILLHIQLGLGSRSRKEQQRPVAIQRCQCWLRV